MYLILSDKIPDPNLRLIKRVQGYGVLVELDFNGPDDSSSGNEEACVFLRDIVFVPSL